MGIFTYAESDGSNFLGTPKPVVPCQRPLTYRFGHIDPRFNTSIGELKNVMKEVEALWSTAMGRDLLDYDPNGEVVINLVYGKDQKRTEEEKALSNRIQILKKQVDLRKNEYQRLMKKYQAQKSDLQTRTSHFEEVVKSYNTDISRWKTAGGIPKSKEQEVEKMQHQISYLQSQINKKRSDVESLRKRINSKSDHLNSIIDQRNQMISHYNDRFSNPQKFDQGRYIRNGEQEKINIFQFSNRAELKTVLAHECGHAMGLGHVDNPKSIMNAMMDQQDIFNLSLTKDDIAAIKNRCK